MPTPAITLTSQEIEEAKQQIAARRLPSDFLDRYYKAVGHQNPDDEKSLDHGVGSRGNETANSFAALKKAEQLGREPKGSYAKAVAEIWQRDPERARHLNLPSSYPTEN